MSAAVQQIDAHVQILTGLADRLAAKAVRQLVKLRRLGLLNLLAWAWLLLFVHRVFHPTLPWLGAIGLALLIPAALVWQLYRMLSPLPELPDRLRELGGSLREVVRALNAETLSELERLRVELREKRLSLAQTVQIGRLLLRLVPPLRRAMSGLQETTRPEVLDSVALMASPVFPILSIVAMVCALGLALLALACLIAYPLLV